jgi:cell shape-determining protein MreC
VGVSREQVGSALRRLAQDLIEERRRVSELERENRELKARIEALEHTVGRTVGERKGRTVAPRQ